MIPTNSGKSSKGCDPVSSNCVIWQGPDLPCINICNGDSVSDVIALLAQQLCDIIDAACECAPDVSDVALNCIDWEGPSPPDFLELQQAIIDYMCDPNNFPGTDPGEVYVDLPPCLQYINKETNTTVYSLDVESYLKFLAGKICDLFTAIDVINGQLTLIWQEINWIKEECCEPPPVITIVSNCKALGPYFFAQGGGSSGFGVHTIYEWAAALEAAFCKLKFDVGYDADITIALSSPCIFSNNPMLSVNANYGDTDITGPWNSPVSSLSQAHVNIWKVLCDLYTAVHDIQVNCCIASCDDIIYEYQVTITPAAGGEPNFMHFDFTAMTVPPLFNDCGAGTVITITDGLTTINNQGNLASIYQLQSQSGGYDMNILEADTGLSPTANYKVTVEFCFAATDGSGLQCEFTETTTVYNGVACPDPITLSPLGTDTLQYSFNTMLLGPAVTVTVYLTNAGVPVTSTTYTAPVTNPISGTFTGLAAATQYGLHLVLTPLGNGTPVECATVYGTTAGAVCENIEQLPAYVVSPDTGLQALGTVSQDGGVTWSEMWLKTDPVTGLPLIELVDYAGPPPCVGDPAISCIGDLTNLGDGQSEFACGLDTFHAGGLGNWFYWDSYITGTGAQYYIYIALEQFDPDVFPNQYQVTNVVFCCECPVWLLDEKLFMKAGGFVIFEPTSVSYGAVTYNIVTPPLYGTVIPGPGIGQFTYEHTSLKSQQDAFQIEMITDCGTTYCWCMVQMLKGMQDWLKGTKVFTFIDTNTIDIAAAPAIVALVTEVVDRAAFNCAIYGGVPPELFIIPVGDSRIVGYQKSIVDRGASAALDPAWVAFQVLPTDWTVPVPSVDVDDVQIFTFCNSAEPGYHANTLITGFGLPVVQPSSDYMSDYDDLICSLTGVANTPWATGAWIDPATVEQKFLGGFRVFNLPVTLGNNGVDSAFLLNSYASLYGTLVPENLWVRDTGITDLAPYLKLPAAVGNPYAGTITPGAGNTIEGLMEIEDMDWFASYDQVFDGITPFDYDPVTNPDLVDLLYDSSVGPDCTTTAIWMLTPCAAFAAFSPIYTESDLSMYPITNALNIDGVCYTPNEVPEAPIPPVPVTVCADSWLTGTDCADCSNWQLTSCVDPLDIMIVCQDLSVAGFNIIEVSGIAVDGCYSVIPTNDPIDYFTPLVINATCGGCVDCVAGQQAVGLAIGNWSLDGDVWQDDGITPAVDLGIIFRLDSEVGTCGAPIVGLSNAYNNTGADELTFETNGLGDGNPDALSWEGAGPAVDSYLSVATDPEFQTGIFTIYAVFAPGSGAGADDNHIWSIIEKTDLLAGAGLIWNGGNYIFWGNDRSNAAFSLSSPGVLDTPTVIACRSNGLQIWFKELIGAFQVADCPWVDPGAKPLTMMGTIDAAGAYPAVNTPSGRLLQIAYFNEAHTSDQMDVINNALAKKWGII